MPRLLANLDAGNVAQVTNLPAPVNPGDAANKAYVDSVAQGLDTKGSVRAATTANITLTAPQTVDGVSLIAGNRVLVKDQTTASQNGIYVVAAGAWTRATDLATGSSAAGAFTFVEEGTTNGETGWVCTNNVGSDVVNTASLVFTQFTSSGTVTAGAALTKTGNTLSVNVDGTTVQILSNNLAVMPVVAFNNHKFVATIGDGTSTSLVVTHNLNTRAISVSIRDVATNAQVIADVVATTVNTATISFASAPASNAFEATVLG